MWGTTQQQQQQQFGRTVVVLVAAFSAFLLPVASQTALSPVDVAVSSSSGEELRAPEKCIDGIVSTYWKSGSMDNEWAVVDLGEAHTVVRLHAVT